MTGSARTTARSDRAVWTISANAQDTSIVGAVAEANRSLDVVTNFLVSGGITADHIALDALSTQVNYEWADGTFTANVASYGAYRSVTIRTDDVDRVAQLSIELGAVFDEGIVVSAYPPQY